MVRFTRVSLLSRSFVVLLLALTLGLLQTVNVFAAGTVTGVVFRDYNANGVQDTREPGIPSATVTGFDAAGATLGTITVNPNGTYTYPWATADTTIRLEFNAPGFQPGANGGMSDTTVQFVSNGDVADVGFNRPGEYCQQNPDVALTCFQFGAQTGSRDVVVRFGYTNGSTAAPWSPPGVDAGGQTNLSLDTQVGTTWGLAYQAMTNSLFAGAFMKRHSGFGTGGPGAIYVIDTAAAPAGALFTTLPNAADPHNLATPQVDGASWDAVGKMGLGDIDIYDDDTTLFAMNLADQRVYQIAINIVGGVPAVGATSSFGFPANPCAVASDFRPFGLGVHDGLVYVGAVCSAESTQSAANLSAHVFVLTPGVGISATPVLSFALNYPRGCTIRNASFPAAPPLPNSPVAPAGNCASARWNPWTPTFPTFAAPQPLIGFGTQDPFEFTYPQPILSDIDFDFNGDMILGFRDRFGDQQGFFVPNPAGAGTFSADVAGDILRACLVGGGYTLESGGNCGTLSSGDVASAQGPGNAEFYVSESYPFHDETTQGGLLYVPGNPDVLTTGYDPVFDTAQPFDGGVLWLSNTNGTRSRAYRIFDAPNNPPFRQCVLRQRRQPR
ncbi:MAG: SdrD B-like domain-containing protein [Anaerolineae bacterium]